MVIGTARNCTLLSCDHRSFTTARVPYRPQPCRHIAFCRRANINFAANPTPEAPEQADVKYVDTWSDVQFINMCRRAYGGLAGCQSPRSWKDGPETYQGMLEVSRALMKVQALFITVVAVGTKMLVQIGYAMQYIASRPMRHRSA